MTETSEESSFRASPFSLVADPESAACWAGRPDIRSRLDKLCRAYARRTDSSVDVIWANFGAGKTHALLHLVHMVTRDYSDRIDATAVFVEMPQNLGSFLDLYRRIITAFPIDTLKACLSDLSSQEASPNLVRAATGLVQGGSSERELARDWLLGGKPYLRDLKGGLGIDSRIESDAAACDILNEVVGLCSKRRTRVLLLVDEFQRIASLAQRKRDAILSNLRTVFSHNPSYLSLVIAISSRLERTALDLIPPELRSLMGMRPVISLPEMSSSEAKDYILGRLEFFRTTGYRGTREAPFTSEMLDSLIGFIEGHEKAKMIPRTLHQALAMVFDELLDSPEQTMSGEATQQLLAELNWEILDMDV